MNREEVIRLLGEDWEMTSRVGKEVLSTDIELLVKLNEYVSNNAGKRLRPMLALLTARICGKPNDATHRYAACSEILHNATLMHDDVADRSSTRRGKPTVSAMVGPEAAVLVGDFWLAKALKLIQDTPHMLSVLQLYAKAISDRAEGEMLQLQLAESGLTTEQDYLRVIYCKTASLFEVTCRAAAISVDAPAEYVDAVCRYALATGIAFQIKDDILDYCGAQTGKPMGLDLKEKKITMPLLGALKDSPREAEIREILRNISPDDKDTCEMLSGFVISNGGVEYASSRLQDYVEEAVHALDIFPDSPEKDCLVQLARYNVMRKS